MDEITRVYTVNVLSRLLTIGIWHIAYISVETDIMSYKYHSDIIYYVI